MPHAGLYVLASLVSGVSAALILASGPGYAEARSLQGTAYDVKRGQSTHWHNECRTSPCQIAYLNSAEDFCLWAPPQPALSATRNTEHTLVAWCTKSAYGTHLIPDGTITGARLVITPDYVQITGVGNLNNINAPADGVATANGEGDRLHGLVFTRAYGQLEQIHDWTSFVSRGRFCFRACKPSGDASTTCSQIHDSFGCSEIVPGNCDTGVFEDCIADAAEAPLALYQEVLAAPSHYFTHPPPGCMTPDTISNAQVARARRAIVSISGSPSTSLASSLAPTTTVTATTITFPSFSTSTLTATTSSNSGTTISSATPTSTPYSYSYTPTHPHWHTHTHRHSRHHFPSLPSSLADPSTTSSTSSPALSAPSFTFTYSAYSSSDPSSSATSTSTSTSNPLLASTSTPASTSSFPFSSDGTSSPLPEPSSQPWSYHSSIPSSAATTTSSPTSLTSPSMSSSTSSQSPHVLTHTSSLSSSSAPTTSPATSSSTLPDSQTQLGSQCPPASLVAVNAGSAISFPAHLLPLMLTTLMIVISSSVGVLVS